MRRRRARFELRRAVDGQVYFVLIAPNGEPVAVSETYPDAATALVGVAAVRRYARRARVVEV